MAWYWWVLIVIGGLYGGPALTVWALVKYDEWQQTQRYKNRIP